MERAAAVLVGGLGVILLTLTAVAWNGSRGAGGGGVDIVAVQVGAPVGPASVVTSGVAEDELLADLHAMTEAATAPTAPVPAGPSLGPAPAPSTTATTGVPPSAAQPAAGGADASPPAPLPQDLRDVLEEIGAGGIRFAVERAELDQRAADLLDRLVGLLATRPDVLVVVRGHTDSTGPDELNQWLSVARARAVVDHLVDRGVAPQQLRVVGLAATEPVADNATPEGRQANRRAEVRPDGRRTP